MKLAHIAGYIFTTISFSVFATSYVPAGEYGGWPHGGYSDVVINSNTAIIKFIGNKYNSPQEARIYMLYRCAEVTLQQGYQYFVITSTSTSKQKVNIRTKNVTKQIYPPASFISNEYTDTEIESYSESSSKAGNCTGNAACSPSAVAVIKMFNGDIPSNLPRAYSAEDVIGHYGYMVDDTSSDPTD